MAICRQRQFRIAVVLTAGLLLLCPIVACHVKQPAAGQSQQPAAKQPGKPASSHPKEITNSLGMKLVLIPPGEFVMGSPDSDPNAQSDEKPQHRVRITKPFYLGVTEVTQEQYERVMGQNPSSFSAAGSGGEKDSGLRVFPAEMVSRFPVEMISWKNAMEFCRRLSQLPEEKTAGAVYRLPTEAEWEYACRAGTTTLWSFGNDKSRLEDYAWYLDNSLSSPHPAGQKKPNAWGLYDMHGNVFEWCADCYAADYYRTSPPTDPKGPDSGEFRVIRGGASLLSARFSRSAIRLKYSPGTRLPDLGFRVVRTP